MLRCIVSVSDKYLWCLRPQSYLFNKFWSSLQPVIVAGYSPPPFSLPSNFEFHSIDNYNYNAEHWTDGLLKFMDWFTDDHFVLLLEDFWLKRTANLIAINSLHDYADEHPEVLRIDLGTDRLYSHDPRYMTDYESWGCVDLIKSEHDWPYTFSTQASIWKRDKFLKFLKPNTTPWNFELHSGDILKEHSDYIILGTRQIPLAYAHVLRSNEPGIHMEGIDPQHIEYIKSQGWLP